MNQNGFKIYRNSLKQVLSEEEQKKYLELSNQGNYEAQEKIFKHNLKLVFFVVDSFFPTSKIDKEDLFQTGSIGLWKAIKSYDLEKDVKFSTYATKKIWGEIKSYSRKSKYLLGIPKSHRLLAKEVMEIKEKFPDENLSTKEISRLLNVDEQEIILSINSMKNILFLSDPISEDKYDETLILGDIIVDTQFSIDEIIEQREISSLINNTINLLDQREQKVINLLYGFNEKIKTQTEISKILNISQPMVSEINKRALNKIKAELVKRAGAIDLLELENRKKYNKNDFLDELVKGCSKNQEKKLKFSLEYKETIK